MIIALLLTSFKHEDQFITKKMSPEMAAKKSANGAIIGDGKKPCHALQLHLFHLLTIVSLL
ncbi:MAG: hypothetical protein K0S07_1613 [Chlamydiales bacterium]|jgi:hypothetical protein|nr:hypothetical protein [Chlamydiales bacterium]